jgi:hypothetical protein
MAESDKADGERLAFERKKADREFALKQRALDLKEREAKRALLKSPWFLALLAAFLGLLGNIFVTWMNATANREIEERRAELNRVLEAITTADPDKAATNLQFLIKTGLYHDRDGTLMAYLNSRQPGTGPTLPFWPAFSSKFGAANWGESVWSDPQQFLALPSQYLIVQFSDSRAVIANSKSVGGTNQAISLPAGHYVITLVKRHSELDH